MRNPIDLTQKNNAPAPVWGCQNKSWKKLHLTTSVVVELAAGESSDVFWNTLATYILKLLGMVFRVEGIEKEVLQMTYVEIKTFTQNNPY